VGLSLVPKGEFSIVLAAMAAAVAHPDTRIETLTGVYVFALSILGPVAMREADRLADLLLARRRRREAAPTSPESAPPGRETPSPRAEKPSASADR
jgi:Kef-type K+ transport system membrane component KefB